MSLRKVWSHQQQGALTHRCHCGQVGVALGAAAILLLAVGLACLILPALFGGQTGSPGERAQFAVGDSTAPTASVQEDVGYSGDRLVVIPEPVLPPGTDTGMYRAGRPYPPPFSSENDNMPALGIPVEKVWGLSGMPPGEPVTPR